MLFFWILRRWCKYWRRQCLTGVGVENVAMSENQIFDTGYFQLKSHNLYLFLEIYRYQTDCTKVFCFSGHGRKFG